VGLYPQPNDWTCGPFALKHALVMLGRIVSEDRIALVAQTHWWSGTSEIRLVRAARAFDCDLRLSRSLSGDRARAELVHAVRQRRPAILCVDDWGHWITVVRYEAGKFVIIDSDRDPVLDAVSWPQLRARWRYRDTDYDKKEPPELYDFYAVLPRFRVTVKADFSLARIRFLRRAENHALAARWNEYVEDLMEICRPRSALQTGAISMGEFLRRHQELIIARVVYWHGQIDERSIVKMLRNMRFVAETYGLVIPSALARRAITDLAVLATLHAASPLYGL
jgi:hypothetical protein